MPGIGTTWLPLGKLLLRERRCSQVALGKRKRKVAVVGGYVVQKGREIALETPSCMLTQHGARTPGYPQAESSGPEAHVMMEGRYPLPVSCPTLSFRWLPSRRRRSEGRGGQKRRLSTASPGRDPEPTEKLLSAAQELKAEPNPLCEWSALAAGGLRVQLA